MVLLRSVGNEKNRINELKSKVAEKAPNWDVFMNLEEVQIKKFNF